MACVHDPVGTDTTPCELCRLTKIEASIKPLVPKNPLPEIEFMGWQVSEWQILRKQWERHYGKIKPSQVVHKTDTEGLNPVMRIKF